LPEQRLPSINQALNSLYQLSVVIDSHGFILFTNDAWKAYSGRQGLSARMDWVGVNYFEIMEELILKQEHLEELRRSLKFISDGEQLVYSAEFPRTAAIRGSSKHFQLEAFPLFEDNRRTGRSIIISHKSAPRIPEQPLRLSSSVIPLRKPPPHTFLPICASCKSIRDHQEQWVKIEQFLQQKLSVQFTHDICPDCIRLLYPKYAHVLEGLAGN